jgi:hypothetical protein
MGWEQRNGSSYYYRKERTGGRVRSVYVGKGLIGGLSAKLDASERGEKEAEREALRREIRKQDAIDAQIDEVCRMTERLTHSALIASGLHLHRGQWRRRRNGKEEG